MRRILMPLLILALVASPATATWSILIVNTRTGEIAIGCATCLTGFNLRQIVPVLVVNRGAACAQASVNISSVANRQIIWNMLQAHATPQQILSALANADPGHDTRQYGIIDVTGQKSTFTGGATFQFADGISGQVGDIHYTVQGNILTGLPVLTAARDAIINTAGDVAEKLMASMQAARLMGGDGRCSCSPSAPTSCGAPPTSFTKSAHIGFMVVARQGDTDGTCNNPALGCASGNYYMTLDVAGQSASAVDPVIQLQGQFNAWRGSLMGRPDHHLSTVSPNPAVVRPGGAPSAVTVALRDWTGASLTPGGATITPTVSQYSTATAAIGPVTDNNDGTYTFDVTPGPAPGDIGLRIEVDDGVAPVLLSPRTWIAARDDPLWITGSVVSAGAFDVLTFEMDAGSGFAGRPYLLGGSLSGTSPGFVVPSGMVVPLNIDSFLVDTLITFANAPFFPNSQGVLDALGRANASLYIPPGAVSALVGASSDWAFVVAYPVDFVSNPASVVFVQ